MEAVEAAEPYGSIERSVDMYVWAMALPITACALLGLAVAEKLWIKFTGMGLLPWLREHGGSPVSAAGFDELNAFFQGTKRDELEHRRVKLMLRDDEADGAPSDGRVDLDAGTAVIIRPGRT